MSADEPAIQLSLPGGPTSLSFRSSLAVTTASHAKASAAAGPFAGVLLRPTFRREMRKLINEAHGRFVELQRQALRMEPVGAAGQVESIRTCSRHYRALLTACVTSLSAVLAQEAEDPVLARVLDQMQESQSVLHLAEVLYIAGAGDADFPVVPELVRWLRMRPTEDDVHMPAELRGGAPEEHPKYWHYACRCVALGRIDEAMALLTAHSQSSSSRAAAGGEADVGEGAADLAPSIDFVTAKLEGMPVPDRARNAGEFYSLWHRWQSDCREAVAGGTLWPELEGVLRVACGEEEPLAAACAAWPELLVARLLYRSPNARAHDLRRDQVEEAVAAMAPAAPASSLEGAMRALFALEPEAGVLELRSAVGEGFAWATAHLADLLHHAGAFDPALLPEEGGVREACLLEYVESLAGVPALRPLAADYLSFCPRSAGRFVPHVLERMEWRTDRQALKLLSACQRQPACAPGFPSLVARAVGSQRLREGRLVAALWWLLRSAADFDEAAAASGASLAATDALLEAAAALALDRAVAGGPPEELAEAACLAGAAPPAALAECPRGRHALAFLAAFAAGRARPDAAEELCGLLASEGRAAAALYAAPKGDPREGPRAVRLRALAAVAGDVQRALEARGGPPLATKQALAVALQDLALGPGPEAGDPRPYLPDDVAARLRLSLLDSLAASFVSGA